MVSATTILIIGGIGIFALAGGIGLSKQAFAQVQTDFSSIKSGVSERVTNVKQTLNREGVETGLSRNEQQVFQTGTVDHFRLSPEALKEQLDLRNKVGKATADRFGFEFQPLELR